MEYLLLLGQLSPIFLFLLAFLKPVRVCFKRTWQRTFGRSGVILREIRTELKYIKEELVVNSGRSMRDVINRIETRQYGFEAFLGAQLSMMDIPIFRTHPDGECYYTNRAYQRMTGFTLPEAKGSGWINIVQSEWRKKVRTLWDLAVEEKREFSEDVLLAHPEGYEYMVHVTGYRELDMSGTLRGYLGTVRLIKE